MADVKKHPDVRHNRLLVIYSRLKYNMQYNRNISTLKHDHIYRVLQLYSELKFNHTLRLVFCLKKKKWTPTYVWTVDTVHT